MGGIYYTVNDFESETLIRRSRFLAVLRKTDTEEEAIRTLEELKSKYHDATHVCYAYRIGENANCARFSDGGEPQGTAGKPILEALVKANATFSLAAVVRWFGGVKLGAGGLTRAYHSSAADAIEQGGKTKYTLSRVYRIECALSVYSGLCRLCEKLGAQILARDFSDKARLEIALPLAGENLATPEAFMRAVADLSHHTEVAFLKDTYIASE